MAKMYEIDRVETGELYKTYRVLAETEEEAQERIWEEEIEPQTEFFKQRDADNFIKELRDCDCDICKRRGAWACQGEEE